MVSIMPCILFNNRYIMGETTFVQVRSKKPNVILNLDGCTVYFKNGVGNVPKECVAQLKGDNYTIVEKKASTKKPSKKKPATDNLAKARAAKTAKAKAKKEAEAKTAKAVKPANKK